MEAEAFLRNPLPFLHGTGAVKPVKKKPLKSLVKRKKF